jgi:riboflavin kinase/FMN adenylyltransferase
MRIAHSVEEAVDFHPSVLTIGKFDGVHAGHELLLHTVVEMAKERGLTPSAFTFDRHPLCVVAPEHVPRPLTTLEQRCDRMRDFGIEQLFILPFTAEIAKLSPEEFIERYLVKAMRAKAIVVGENFRFGHKHAGDPALLATLGERYGFETRVAPAVKLRGLIVSASEIRNRIENGQVALAARLLRRPYALSGEVVHGRGVGSKQTVPTLNLRTTDPVWPKDGVYITRTDDLDQSRSWKSITNVGVRPTFGLEERTVETFLLEPLTGETPSHIRVEFLERVREERTFESPEALKQQIFRDVAKANNYFRRLSRWVRVSN